MEREQLDRLIRTPHAVEQQDMAALRELSERAPWFAGAQLLRTVGERRSGDVRSDSWLQRAAAHIPSRTVLYDLVERPLQTAEERGPAVMKVVTDQGGKNKLGSGANEAPAQVPTAMVTAKEEVNSAEPITRVVEVSAVPVEVPPAPVADAEAPITVVGLERTAPVAAAVQASEDPLERQILGSALASIYDLTLHAPPPREVKPTVAEVPAASEPTPVEETPAAADQTIMPSVEAVAPVIGEAKGRLRFTSWLSATEAEAPLSPARPPTPAPALALPDAAPAEPLVGAPSAAPVPSAKLTAPVDAGSLIDRFIQQETPAPTKKATFFTPQQAAKKSLDDSAGLVTETLARIYEKQGNLQKAIDAYRKLALKYPEKSAYFAALSRSLEEQLNT